MQNGVIIVNGARAVAWMLDDFGDWDDGASGGPVGTANANLQTGSTGAINARCSGDNCIFTDDNARADQAVSEPAGGIETSDRREIEGCGLSAIDDGIDRGGKGEPSKSDCVGNAHVQIEAKAGVEKAQQKQ
jgi:hypothetical protein